jgi:hypothetical protein
VSGPGSISSTGLYSAPSTPVAGTAVVQAVSTTDPSKTVTVSIPLQFGTIEIASSATVLDRSAIQPFMAEISGMPYTNVTWSVSPAVGIVNAAGQYTAPDTLSQDTTVTLTATSNDDPRYSGSTTVTIKVLPATIRVNCSDTGGFTDAMGNVWATDYGFSGAYHSYSVSNVPIARTTPDLYTLYDSSRYSYAGESFQYSFPLPNGFYLVTLKFADYTYSGPGSYIFDVQINGATVLHNFDPDAVYGTSKTAVDVTALAVSSNKSVTISFSSQQAGGAFVNGIEIQPVVAFSRKMSGTTLAKGRVQ